MTSQCPFRGNACASAVSRSFLGSNYPDFGSKFVAGYEYGNSGIVTDSRCRKLDTFPNWEHIAAMRIIAWSRLAEFARTNPAALAPLTKWRAIVRAAKWTSMNDVRRLSPNATVLNAERVKFQMGGGNYRLIVALNFKTQIALVRFIGTHAEYDKIDALTVSQF